MTFRGGGGGGFPVSGHLVTLLVGLYFENFQNTKFLLFTQSLLKFISIWRFLGTFGSLGMGGYMLKILKISLHAKFLVFNLFLLEIIRHYILLILVL